MTIIRENKNLVSSWNGTGTPAPGPSGSSSKLVALPRRRRRLRLLLLVEAPVAPLFSDPIPLGLKFQPRPLPHRLPGEAAVLAVASRCVVKLQLLLPNSALPLSLIGCRRSQSSCHRLPLRHSIVVIRLFGHSFEALARGICFPEILPYWSQRCCDHPSCPLSFCVLLEQWAFNVFRQWFWWIFIDCTVSWCFGGLYMCLVRFHLSFRSGIIHLESFIAC